MNDNKIKDLNFMPEKNKIYQIKSEKETFIRLNLFKRVD